MLNRTRRMFTYVGLPDTIPEKNLEMILQSKGVACFTMVNNNLYAFSGGLGGEPNPYYEPTKFTVANPALNFSANLNIGTDCELVSNDTMRMGLLPIFGRYATLITENDLTMNMYNINTRVHDLIIAENDSDKAAADRYLEGVESGKNAAIASKSFIEGLKTQPYSSSAAGRLTELIEYQQYLKSGWFSEIGLRANYNMKRESISANEAKLDDDVLLPLVDDMLFSRIEGLEKVNKLFGTDISVSLSSAWREVRANENSSGDYTELVGSGGAAREYLSEN